MVNLNKGEKKGRNKFLNTFFEDKIKSRSLWGGGGGGGGAGKWGGLNAFAKSFDSRQPAQ